MHLQCLSEKFFHKVHLIWLNQDTLGISKDVMEKINDLKIETKKRLIKDAAEIDVLAVDITVKLWEEQVDTKDLDALLDKKYSIKKERAKAVVNAYLSLAKLLNAEQKRKMKELCKVAETKEKQESCCR